MFHTKWMPSQQKPIVSNITTKSHCTLHNSPMCWCLRVSLSVLTNLCRRLFIDGCSRSHPVVEDVTDREEFHKEVSREMAEKLLEGKQNGTFIIRPSKNCNLGTMSVVQDEKVFHLGVRRREDGRVALGVEKADEKSFKDLNSLINYYVSNYLVVFSRGEKVRILLLPYREKNWICHRLIRFNKVVINIRICVFFGVGRECKKSRILLLRKTFF